MIRTILITLLLIPLAGASAPLYETELIFPLEKWHNHSSCIVEQPDGDLLVCWFHGSGERTADDVSILGARKVKGQAGWSAPFVMADTPEFPDTNCCMIIDPSEKLWLIWPTIIANRWETALLKIRTSTDYQRDVDAAPSWDWQEILHVRPQPGFEEDVNAALDTFTPTLEAIADQAMRDRAKGYIAELRKRAGEKYFRRMGWMTRAHPTILPSGRMIVPLYSDGYSFSLMAITDDWGETWQFSNPLVGGGNIQPSIVRKKDGTLAAVMRDNGPPPKRILISESKDNGLTWGPVTDYFLPNPGAGLEWIVLDSGEWALVYNDTEQGRHSLAVSISDDEGKTWKWTRHLERVEPEKGSYSYPSILQARDGTLHATYSHHGIREQFGDDRKSIKCAHFNIEWVKMGD